MRSETDLSAWTRTLIFSALIAFTAIVVRVVKQTIHGGPNKQTRHCISYFTKNSVQNVVTKGPVFWWNEI